MLRLLVWLSVSVLLLFLCWKFAAWRIAAQLALLACTAIWVLVGGLFISRAWKGAGQDMRAANASRLEQMIQAERVAFINRFGLEAAAEMDREQPGFWARQAYAAMGKK